MILWELNPLNQQSGLNIDIKVSPMMKLLAYGPSFQARGLPPKFRSCNSIFSFCRLTLILCETAAVEDAKSQSYPSFCRSNFTLCGRIAFRGACLVGTAPGLNREDKRRRGTKREGGRERRKMWRWEDVKMRRWYTDPHYQKNPSVRRSREPMGLAKATHLRS